MFQVPMGQTEKTAENRAMAAPAAAMASRVGKTWMAVRLAQADQMMPAAVKAMVVTVGKPAPSCPAQVIKPAVAVRLKVMHPDLAARAKAKVALMASWKMR